MRSLTGAILLALLTACETVPENVKIDVDGRTFEFKKKPAATVSDNDEPR